jgi:MFS family permease
MSADEHVETPVDPTEPVGDDDRGAPRRTESFARRTWRAARSAGRGARTVGIAGVHGARRAGEATGRATGRAAGFTFRQARRASHAEGAGESGLSRLIELHAFNAAGDAAVAISLAGTLFFQVPTGEARGKVALFLALTMLPFAIVAPLIGPFLDRFTRGRRWAIGTTMALRAFLCWVMANSVHHNELVMFPAALGVLVASKAYTVTRAAAVPRLLPPQLDLVKANSKISLAGVAGGAVAAPLAGGAALLGPQWSLRFAFLVFVGGTILAILLPARVDNAPGEELDEPGARKRRRTRFPRPVVIGLRANAGLRVLSGFLTLYMAFLLRDQPFPGFEHHRPLLLGLVVGAVGVGSTIGTGLGNLLRNVRPDLSVLVTLVADAAVTVLAAAFYSLPTAVILGLTTGLAQSFGKLCLDSLIQREVPERHRSTAFGRSETLIQLSWVVGGFIGIALPLVPRLGLGVAAAILLAWLAWTLAATTRHRAERVMGS